MNDETMYENQEVKNTSEDEVQNNESFAQIEHQEGENPDAENPVPEQPAPEAARKKGMNTGAAVGIAGGAAVMAGAAGVGLGVLTPKYVFPYMKDIAGSAKDLYAEAKEYINDLIHGSDGSGDADVVLATLNDGDIQFEEVKTPTISEQVVGHDMDVALSVNDSMSFNQAFAAARQELGAGGLFVWHGNTYGTYYANEWNSMTDEDKEQYWADVNHTTSHIEYDPMDNSVLTNDMAKADEMEVIVDVDDDLVEAEVNPDVNPDELGDTALLVETDEANLTEVEVNVNVDDADAIEMADTFAVEYIDSENDSDVTLGENLVDDGGLGLDVIDMGQENLMTDSDLDMGDLV